MKRRGISKIVFWFTAGWIFSGQFLNPPFSDFEAIVAIILLVAGIISSRFEEN
jgi:hypothetical protein